MAGGIGAATGGAVFLAAGGSATVAGAGGFVAGLASGAAGAAAQNVALGVGNFLGYDEKYDPKSFVRDVAFGGLMGGVVNGAIAGFKGNNFWSGSPKASGYGTFSFGNNTALGEEGWSKLSNGKWFRAGNDNAIYGPVEKQLADGSMAWSDNFAGHKTGDIYGGGQSTLTEAAVHGNSLKSLKPTWGYKLYSQDGTFLKNGITSKAIPETRYSKGFMSGKKMLEPILFPNRRTAYEWEFLQNTIQKGTLNKNMH